jgi:hypothetical protein
MSKAEQHFAPKRAALRRMGWEDRLNHAIEAARSKPFEWGRHDCALFAADVAHALTGIDPAVKLRGQYSTALTAARVARTWGGFAKMTAAICAAHGFAAVPVSYARRGDLVRVRRAGGEFLHALGVCLGSVSAFTGPDGLVFLPTAECVGAWRIPTAGAETKEAPCRQ